MIFPLGIYCEQPFKRKHIFVARCVFIMDLVVMGNCCCIMDLSILKVKLTDSESNWVSQVSDIIKPLRQSYLFKICTQRSIASSTVTEKYAYLSNWRSIIIFLCSCLTICSTRKVLLFKILKYSFLLRSRTPSN